MIEYTPEQFNQCVKIWQESESVLDAVSDILEILNLHQDDITNQEWCEFTKKLTDAAANTAFIGVGEAHQSTLAAPRVAKGTNDPLVSGFDLTNPRPMFVVLRNYALQ